MSPKVTTIDAPAGASKVKDTIIPRILPATPKVQPKISLETMLFTKSNAAAAGTMRKEKTNRTPAIFTELVTTKPKVT